MRPWLPRSTQTTYICCSVSCLNNVNKVWVTRTVQNDNKMGHFV